MSESPNMLGFASVPMVLGAGFNPRQVIVTTTPAQLVHQAQTRNYAIMVVAGTPVYIGRQNVTVASGWRLPVDTPVMMTVLENVEIWAVAESTVTVYVCDMGVRSII